MNKGLIERLAHEIEGEYLASPEPLALSWIAEQAIARYLAERGKAAVGYLYTFDGYSELLELDEVEQGNFAKQAAEIERLSSHVEDAKEIIQKMMKAEKQQADRIKALESEKIGWDNTNAHQHAAELRLMEEVRKLKTEKDKADGVILQAGSALQEVQDFIGESSGVYGLHLNGDSSPWSEIEQGGRFERLCALPDALTAIEQYQKGE